MIVNHLSKAAATAARVPYLRAATASVVPQRDHSLANNFGGHGHDRFRHEMDRTPSLNEHYPKPYGDYKTEHAKREKMNKMFFLSGLGFFLSTMVAWVAMRNSLRGLQDPYNILHLYKNTPEGLDFLNYKFEGWDALSDD